MPFPLGPISGITKLIKIKDHSAAGTSPITSSAIDMDQDGGYDGALIFTSFGTPATNNVMKAQQSDDDGSSDAYSDLLGSQTIPGASDEDVWIEVFRPTKRYLKVIATPGTSSTVESIWALLYGARDTNNVTNQVTGTIIGTQLISPAEGTA